MEVASISTALYPLAALACPVGMGVMMWVMMKGNRRGSGEPRQPDDSSMQRTSIELLREEHRRLGEEIEGLESQQHTEPVER